MGLFDTLRDKSIFFSFDSSGYRRHARHFDPNDLDRSMREKICIVTGANSGLGFEVARGLAAREATVHMLCRNAERGKEARKVISEEHGSALVHVHIVDLSSPDSIRRFADAFGAPSLAEDDDQDRIAKLRRRAYGDDRDGRHLVIFSVEKELPLVGAA